MHEAPVTDPAEAGETGDPGAPGAPGDPGDRPRCPWAVGPWLMPYHDEEWGVPDAEDSHHFEHLVLEGAQAGLSWLSVLKRREAYRRAFHGFDPEVVAGFGGDDVARLMEDGGLIRNRRKIESAVANAEAFCALRETEGTFAAYLLGHLGGVPVVNRWTSPGEVPASTPVSEAISKDLRRRGFRFVGPIVCYSHLQSVGLVLDHLTSCYRFDELAGGA